MPNWNDILQELPRLEDLMSKLERWKRCACS